MMIHISRNKTRGRLSEKTRKEFLGTGIDKRVWKNLSPFFDYKPRGKKAKAWRKVARAATDMLNCQQRLEALEKVSDSEEKEILRKAIQEAYELTLFCAACEVSRKTDGCVCDRHFHDYCCPCDNEKCYNCLLADEKDFW